MPSLNNNLYEFGDFSLDAQSRALRRGEATVPLTPKAFDVLLILVQNAGKIVSKDELMKAVWPDSFVEESNLTQTVFMVRKSLDETADRRYVQTVQGRGYRLLVPVVEREASSTLDTVPAVSGALPEVPSRTDAGTVSDGGGTLKKPASRRRLQLVGIAALLVAALGIYWVTLRGRAPAPSAAARPMLAVLPFENFTGDPRQDYFSDGMTEEMISQLGNFEPAHLGVIARTSVMHYKHSQEPIAQIGKELGVGYVIEGSVRRDAERVRITAQLIQVKDQSHLWAREYDRDLGHLLELQEEIAREVASEIEFSLGGRRPTEVTQAAAAPAPGGKSYEVYDLYLKGRYFWNKRTPEGFRQAADYFQQAIDKDPNYGRAYAGLADTFSLMSTWFVGPQNELMPKARAAALRALKLDERLAEAHASLALIKENYDYDWPGAEKEFRRAIQLNPQYATAHQWYAEFLSWQGRFQEAFAESDRARQSDPLSLIIASDHAMILYYSRQYDSALKQCRSILELDPNYDRALDLMIRPYLQLGRYDEAIDALNRWAAHYQGPWMWAWKAAVYGRSGHAEEARRALAKLEQVPGPDRTAILSIAYAGTGQKERVIQLLQRAYSEHSHVVLWLKVDPMYDLLRGDSRFQDLLRKLALAPGT
ncbi:MAG: winged helix-turn-helix domain-containing protein [Acidobacteriaceae bacterium]|nr:winged helix-turn-helix domain-containing protein [Acidobacteriaceae bacterium]MBV9295832.1 winged helix-turn-helix domain-containing protein [Acidobacteriaceae bacterium]